MAGEGGAAVHHDALEVVQVALPLGAAAAAAAAGAVLAGGGAAVALQRCQAVCGVLEHVQHLGELEAVAQLVAAVQRWGAGACEHGR